MRTLAPYAMLSRMSRGRRFPEPPHPMRTAFQRDRDRIVHSAAFRRLEYKTQVFVNHEGDYYRTRLTHTVEAAQITRTVARALGINSELAEAVALAHDGEASRVAALGSAARVLEPQPSSASTDSAVSASAATATRAGRRHDGCRLARGVSSGRARGWVRACIHAG